MTTLTDELHELRDLKAARDDAKEAFEDAEATFKDKQRALLERMDDEGCESQRVDGTTFTPVKQQYGTVQDREAFVEWAEANDPELIERKERGSLLNQLVRERLDNGQGLPEGVGFYTREYISMRNS